jgi:hypothetical protein
MRSAHPSLLPLHYGVTSCSFRYCASYGAVVHAPSLAGTFRIDTNSPLDRSSDPRMLPPGPEPWNSIAVGRLGSWAPYAAMLVTL